jgi:hypothetical protein
MTEKSDLVSVAIKLIKLFCMSGYAVCGPFSKGDMASANIEVLSQSPVPLSGYKKVLCATGSS